MPYKPTLTEVDTAGNLNHLVDKTIGNAYSVVREVYKNLPFLKFLADRVDGVSPIEFRDNAELERVEWKYMADQPDDWKVLITYTSLTALAQQYKEETLVLRNEVSDLKDGTQALVDALLVELENNFNEDFAAFMLTAEVVRDQAIEAKDISVAQTTIATEQADRAEGQADRAEAIVDQSLIYFEGAIFGYFNTYAAALAGFDGIPNGAQVRIKEDENFGGATTEYFVTGPMSGESLVLDFLTDTYIIRELIFVRILQSPNIYLPPVTAPAAPSVGFILYVDEADGDLKAVSADNTVTTLASL